MSWHADPLALRAYADGTAPDSVAWSIETLLSGCAVCRAALSHHLAAEDRDLLTAARARLVLSGPAVSGGWLGTVGREGWVGRLSRRPWPAVRSGVLGPWWAWAGFVVVSSVLLGLASLVPTWRAAVEARADGLVLLSPVLPVALVAVVYAAADRGPVSDTTPRGGLELVLTRTAAVLALTVPLVALIRSFHGVPAAAWLLPGLCLCVGSLALGSWVGVERAAIAVTTAWVGACVVALAPLRVRVPWEAVLVQAPWQPLWWILLVGSMLVVLWRRDHFDILGSLHSRHRRRSL